MQSFKLLLQRRCPQLRTWPPNLSRRGNGSPFDRILYVARHVIDDVSEASASEPEASEGVGSETWLAPWRGSPTRPP
jgi:hypothetical protein